MKNAIRLISVILLCITFTIPTYALYTNESETTDLNIIISTDEFNQILSNGNMYFATERATGLIDSGGVGIDNDFKMLRMAGIINCDVDVVKCGFEDIIVQRRASASSSWTTYHTFDDYYIDSPSNSIIRAVTVVTGYEYRVILTLYAKKNIFSVQRIDIESNILAF